MDPLFYQAFLAFDSGRYDEAERFYALALAKYPFSQYEQYKQAAHGLAFTCCFQNKFDQALRYVDPCPGLPHCVRRPLAATGAARSNWSCERCAFSLRAFAPLREPVRFTRRRGACGEDIARGVCSGKTAGIGIHCRSSLPAHFAAAPILLHAVWGRALLSAMNVPERWVAPKECILIVKIGRCHFPGLCYNRYCFLSVAPCVQQCKRAKEGGSWRSRTNSSTGSIC